MPQKKQKKEIVKKTVIPETAPNTVDTVDKLNVLIAKAKKAQQEYENYSQEQVDKIFKAAATAANKVRISLAKMAVEETKRGVFELDDLLHNTLGVMIGYLLYRTAVTLCEASRRRPVRIAAAFA